MERVVSASMPTRAHARIRTHTDRQAKHSAREDNPPLLIPSSRGLPPMPLPQPTTHPSPRTPESSMTHATCRMQRATCNMQNGPCSVQLATCSAARWPQAREWIEAVLGTRLPSANLHDSLKDGTARA